MKYTIKDLRKDFPNDDVCLDYIFAKKYPEAKGYCRVNKRKCYANPQGHQIHPLTGTIFEKSSTPLTLWLHAIFLFSTSKNGVSAKELQRQLGVTYKCAWRIAKSIRELMTQDGDPLTGTIEADETYIGGTRRMDSKMKNKSVLLGAVRRQGNVKAKVVKKRDEMNVAPFIARSVTKGSLLITDEALVYNTFTGYGRATVKHSKYEYVRGAVHTNTIEGFWSQLKRSIHGTYHSVSPKHLQKYVDEFVFRYNLRTSSVPVFEVLLSRV